MIQGNSLRIVLLTVVIFLLFQTLTTATKPVGQEVTDNYHSASNNPIHQLASSPKIKIENSSQHPTELSSENKQKGITESFTISPVKKTSKQNYDSAKSITSSKLTENNEEEISSSYLYVNTTFCDACYQDQARTILYVEYTGTVLNQTLEITPYFRIDDEEPSGTYYVPQRIWYRSSNTGPFINSIEDPWQFRTYSHTVYYGQNLGFYSIVYRIDTSSSYGYIINAVTLYIIVVDTKNPIIIDSPEDIGFPLDGTQNFELNWTATDTFPYDYRITQNGTFVDYGIFHSNQTISYQGLRSQLSPGVNEFNITIRDTSGNSASHTVNVIVGDIVPPVFEHPSNLVYPVGATGNRLVWKPVDLSTPGSYTLFSPIGTSSGTWNNNDEITVNIDDLPVGVHNYTIIIRDFYGNFGQDTVLVTVYDPSPPEINPVDSVIIEDGALDQTLSWTPIDSNPSHYTLKKDGIILVQNQQWLSGEKVEISLNGLPVGTNRYEITFYDIDGWSISDSVTVNVVDTTSPAITQELTQIIERDVVRYNPQFYYLNWLLTDLNPTAYTITVNDTIVQSDSWEDGDEVLYFLSETELGTYNYTITVYDLHGNTAQQSVEVVVQDTLSPTINNLSDKAYDYGNYNHRFSWTVTDGQPARYNITINDTLVQEGSWDSNQAIEFTSIKPELGSYQFVLQVWDGFGNFARDSFILRIGDSDTPRIVSPGSQLFELWTSQSIAWIVTDLSGDGIYEISKNGEIVKTGSWINGIPIELQAETNVAGTYSYEILVKDIVGTVAIDQVSIGIFVTSSASHIPEVADRILEFGTTGEMLIWHPVSFNNGNYTISRNGQFFDTNPYWLSKDPINISLDNLSLGDHRYNLTIFDFSNTLATDIVTVTVRDTTEPEIIASCEVEFSIANTQRFFHWRAIDWHPGNYQFTLGTQFISHGSWISNQENVLQLSNHGIGTYNYTLIVLDHLNNSLNQTITVIISDKLKPIITPVANGSYEFGNEAQPITWLVIDETSDYFKIYKNEILFHSDFWETGQAISVNITGLPVGTYNYTLLAYDRSQNVASATVFIRIEDTTSPVLEASDDLYLQMGQTGQTITWRVFDLQAGNYTLWEDGILFQVGTWLSGEALTFSITANAMGTYEYMLQIVDSSLNMASSSIFVFTTDQLPPRVSVIQSELTFEYGSIGNELIWDVFESGNWNYTIIRDKILLNTLLNEAVIEGKAKASQIITQIANTSQLGTYFYTLSIVDSAQNTASRMIVVNIVDTTKPALIEEPSIRIFNYEQSYFLNWSADDLLPGNYEISLNGNLMKSGAWENQDRINYSLTQLLPGNYDLTVIFSDSSGNSAYSTKFLQIEDKTLPSIHFTGNINYELNSTGYTLSWEVSDDFPEELIVVKNLYLSQVEISSFNLSEIATRFNQPVDSDIESLHDLYQYLLTTEGAVLVYKQNYGKNFGNSVITPQIAFTSAKNISYTVLVYDQSRNLNYASQNISIIDTIHPKFTLTPDKASHDTEFTWSANDLAPAGYTIMINGSIHETGSWNSASKINTSLNELEPGFYEIVIRIHDESLNNNSYEFYFTKERGANQSEEIPRVVKFQIFSTEKKIQYEMGDTTNHIITWNRPIRASNIQYELYENGKLTRTSEVWPEKLQLSLDLNYLFTGTHNFTLRVKIDNDFYRNTTIVKVQDTTSPSITTNHETDAISSVSGNIVTVVELSDINPDIYYVYLNNSFMNSGSWKNGEVIVINVLGLQPGNYELFIIGYDSHANDVRKRLNITVHPNQLNTQRNQSSLEIVQYAWWFILVAVAIAIGFVVGRKVFPKLSKKDLISNKRLK